MHKIRKIEKKKWIIISLIALLMIVIVGTVKWGWQMWGPQQRGLITMMGIKGEDPTQLPSYQAVNGVVDIQHWTVHGVPVYFVEVPALPMVDIEVVWDAGAARNGAKGGLAYLTNTLLAEGTSKLSADHVAESFDNVGAQYNASSQRDMASVNLRSVSDPALLLPALETFTAIISQPMFPESGFQREKKNVLISLKKQGQNPAQVASRAFYSAVYPNQPYANWVLGDQKSVEQLTVNEVKAFHQQYYVAQNALIAIVGDLRATEANAIAEKIAISLSQGSKPVALPAVENLETATVEQIIFPSSQTHILMGEPLIKQGDPDYYALYTGNHILGGNGSVSRIFNIIRTQHGLAYSAYSYFQPMQERGPYVIGCQTRNEEADKALALLHLTLQEYVEKGPTDKELEDAKRNIIGGYALNFDSNALITQQIASLGFYQLPLDHFDQFKQAVEKLTTQDIQQAFQKHVSPDKLAVVMVGKRGTN